MDMFMRAAAQVDTDTKQFWKSEIPETVDAAAAASTVGAEVVTVSLSAATRVPDPEAEAHAEDDVELAMSVLFKDFDDHGPAAAAVVADSDRQPLQVHLLCCGRAHPYSTARATFAF